LFDKVISKLKTGTITNVVPYGSPRPTPPYIVVRPEQDSLQRGRMFRIFVHYSPGGQAWLEDYCFGELVTLLNNYSAEDRKGNVNILLVQQGYQDIVINNDDGTISMARDFLMPSRTF